MAEVATRTDLLYAVIVDRVDEARINTVTAILSSFLYLEPPVVNKVLKKAPIALFRDVTADEFKQIRSYLLEISTHGVSFQITDRPDAKLPKVNWPGKPDLQALFSGDPGDRVRKALGGEPPRVAGQTRVLRSSGNGELERFAALRLECTVRKLDGFEDAALLQLAGLVDPESMVAFESHIARVRHRGFSRVVLDFENVRYVSAMGLTTLARLVEPTGHPSTAAIAVSMPPTIASVTSMLRLQERMTILEGVDDAVAALTSA